MNELEALKIVLDMAKGNLHCPQDEKRRKAVKIISTLIKKSEKKGLTFSKK